MIYSIEILDDVKCIEAYPTLHKVPNNPNGLHYSDHLAVYALFEIDENISEKQSIPLKTIDEETRNNLRSACIIVEESIQRNRRHRIFCVLIVILLTFLLFSLNGHPLSNGYLSTIFIILKNLLCLIGIAICIWFIGLGKPVERNALRSIENAMHLRLSTL